MYQLGYSLNNMDKYSKLLNCSILKKCGFSAIFFVRKSKSEYSLFVYYDFFLEKRVNNGHDKG